MLKDAGCSDGLQRLEVIRKLNAKSGWINSDLYRLLFKPELYVLAYERIKSKSGNMTQAQTRKPLTDLVETKSASLSKR
jgi:hypothetical protein